MLNEWHRILQVPPDSSHEIIRSAYRKLILKHHPDKGGSDEKFKDIQSAYEFYLTKNKPNIIQQMDYIDSRMSKECISLIEGVLTYIVDCRLCDLYVTRDILANCLKIKGVRASGYRLKNMIYTIFIGISNERIINALKELNIDSSGTRNELIEKLLYNNIKLI